MFRRSIHHESAFPDVWKIFSVTPIFKSDEKSKVTNYRPISIIPHVAKIFESIVYLNVKRRFFTSYFTSSLSFSHHINFTVAQSTWFYQT